MHSAILNHWAPIFSAKYVDESAIHFYLNGIFTQRPERNLPTPDAHALERAAHLAHDSAPGPDRLPYRAWLQTPSAFT
eukprot:5263351-Pyramimonas_sp.AAC.1